MVVSYRVVGMFNLRGGVVIMRNFNRVLICLCLGCVDLVVGITLLLVSLGQSLLEIGLLFDCEIASSR